MVSFYHEHQFNRHATYSKSAPRLPGWNPETIEALRALALGRISALELHIALDSNAPCSHVFAPGVDTPEVEDADLEGCRLALYGWADWPTARSLPKVARADAGLRAQRCRPPDAQFGF